MKELESLEGAGFAILKSFLTDEQCTDLIKNYSNDKLYRNTIDMKRYRFGQGQYRYYNYPLPDIIQKIRTELYEPLAVIANDWHEKLSIDLRYPETHKQFLDVCHTNGQLRPTPLILRYDKGGHNTLHQDLYGDIYFPFQVVFMLTQQGVDYQGGEFVLTEQLPRAQSIVRVVHADKGDAVVFTTNFKPVNGTRGYYRAKLKHGVSEVLSGQRYAMGIIFHEAR